MPECPCDPAIPPPGRQTYIKRTDSRISQRSSFLQQEPRGTGSPGSVADEGSSQVCQICHCFKARVLGTSKSGVQNIRLWNKERFIDRKRCELKKTGGLNASTNPSEDSPKFRHLLCQGKGGRVGQEVGDGHRQRGPDREGSKEERKVSKSLCLQSAH